MNPVSAYRWQLSEALQSSTEPATLYRVALRLLAEHLRVPRVVHIYRDGPEIVVDHEYAAPGVTSMIGRVPIARFSPEAREDLFVTRTRVVADTATAPHFGEPEQAFLAALAVRAYMSVALAKRWGIAGGFVIHSPEPRAWTADEIALVVETADRTWDAVQRATAEREVRESAHRDAFRLRLSDALRNLDDEESIRNAAVRQLGEYLQVNRVFYMDIDGAVAILYPEYRVGVDSIAGVIQYENTIVVKAAREGVTLIVDDAEADPRISPAELTKFRSYQNRAMVSVGIKRGDDWTAAFVVHSREPRRWAAEEIALVEDTAQRLWSALVRVRGERQLREAAARDALRLRLADVVRLATDAGELRTKALTLLGEHLKADRLILIERDGSEFIAHSDYAARLPAIPGRYSTEHFPSASAAFHRGETVAVTDVATDPNMSEQTRAAYTALGARAVLAVPLFRSGELVAALSMHMAEPRQWREDEVVLMHDGGERTWAAMERLHQERALRESEAALREAARNKDAFLAMLAHELRNPLAPLYTSIELLYRAVEDPRMLIEITAIMERQLRHVMRLVDDLLDAARITNGSIRIERAPVPLARIIDEAAEMHRRACKDRDITVTKVVDRAVTVNVDHIRMVQVISNLIHNAVKFTDEGGRIAIHASAFGRNVTITVEDTGVGIAPELIPVVFELFRQAGNERSGLGVGLALCRQLVELHGGTITARARDGGSGSVFEILLPDIVTTEAAAPEKPAPTRALTTNREVLIVDDNEDIVRATSILFSSLGAKVHVATDGKNALKLAQQVKPASVLLDIGMPGLDGYEVCRQLRAMFGSDIRLVAYTGWGKPEDKKRALEAGFDVHITKPAPTDSLARALLLKR